MSDDFLKLDDVKEMKILENGKLVIVKPINHSPVTPLFCPVCEFPMKTSDDAVSYKTYKSCYECGIHFAHPNLEKWKTGWRPTPEELSKYKLEKELVSIPVLKLK